jgi:WD40 repeat protein
MAGGRKGVWSRLRGHSNLPSPHSIYQVYLIIRPLQSIAIGVSSSRKLFATACRATTAKHAAVRIYETETFRPFGQPLEGHTLTVTHIAFSPDDQLVLTVSRDRSWRLFRKEESGPSVLPLSFQIHHEGFPLTFLINS